MLATLLFGLSMDDEVLLVTRMREAWDRTKSNVYAVAGGLANTSRIVTAAGRRLRPRRVVLERCLRGIRLHAPRAVAVS